MGIGDAILLVSCLAGLMMALPALLIFLNIAFVGTSDRAAFRLSRGGFIPFFVGVFFVLLIGVPSAALMAVGSIFQFFGSLIFLLLLLIGFLGLASVSRLIGYRVIELGERHESPLIQAVAGATVLSFGIAFPLLGWFIVLPFGLLVGIGAVILATISRWFGSDGNASTLHSTRTEVMQRTGA